MKLFPNAFLALLVCSVVGHTSSLGQTASGSPQGRWDAALTLNQTVVPFRLDVSGGGSSITGTLFNGDLRQTTTSASFEGGRLTLNFDQFLTRIVATLGNGQLTGTVDGRFEAGRYISSYPLTATRHVDAPDPPKGNAPRIDGTWEIEHESAKGEKAWRFIVSQHSDDVSASILRVDGDTGALVGTYKNGEFLLSHFDGTRPLVAEVTTETDGSLRIQLKGGHAPTEPLIARRPEVARSKGLPAPANFSTHTTVRNPDEGFKFAFPDINGHLVSSDDPQFKGIAYLAVITGTWCPNCHDETPYLVRLYEKYHRRGLEIVALDFEEPEQQKDLSRAKAFIKKYNVPYTYLIAGEPSELGEKIPQAVNLNTWPATFFIGKDGLVHKVHAGFAAPASGAFNLELQSEYTSEIENLLAQNPSK
jgi:thiol-disulfide isomerase/thioredoxin